MSIRSIYRSYAPLIWAVFLVALSYLPSAILSTGRSFSLGSVLLEALGYYLLPWIMGYYSATMWAVAHLFFILVSYWWIHSREGDILCLLIIPGVMCSPVGGLVAILFQMFMRHAR